MRDANFILIQCVIKVSWLFIMNRIGLLLCCCLCLVIIEFGVIIHLLRLRIRDDHVWTPLQGPSSEFPCKGNKDIIVWLDDLTSYNIDKYYVYINKNFSAGSVVNIKFDAEVNVTFPEQKDVRLSMSLIAGDALEIRFIDTHTGLTFNVMGLTTRFPNITSLSIDEVEYCKESDMRLLKKFIEDRNSTTDKNQWYAVSRKSSQPNFPCGRRSNDTGLVTNGVANPGDWPWHVAVYAASYGGPFKYVGGGTLVSPTFVITAAQCTELLRATGAADRFSVVLGKYNLQSRDDDKTTQIEVERVITPDSYKIEILIDDIALLKLKSSVKFSEFIRPACLWHKRERPMDVADDGIVGTLAGWGYTNDNDLSQPLQQVNLPIVSRKTCIDSNPTAFTALLQKNDFCAGYHNNGTSACNGDNGGALQVFIPDGGGKVSGAWYLRGILTKGVRDLDTHLCDENQYSVFTDAAKFSDWIDRFVND